MTASGRASLTVGIDLGGTKLAGALVDADGRVEGYTRWPEPLLDYGNALEALGDMVSQFRTRAADAGCTIGAVGLAAAAFLDAERSEVLHAANLGWRDRPLRRDLSDRVGLPVALDNDADAAAWGEYSHGAGAGTRSLLLVTLGTGVGGGAIVDGRLLTGGSGLGGEIGHLVVDYNGLTCVCGGVGCLEMYASGRALARIARSGADADRRAAPALLVLAEGDPERIDGPMVVAAARRGDTVAVAAIGEVAHWLGRGLAQATALLDPSLILIGGGVSAAEELLLAPTRTAYAEAVTARGARRLAPIRCAELGGAAGVVGAAARARALVLDPGANPRVSAL